MMGEKFYSKSKLIRMGALIFLLGGSIGGLTARLFPEPIKTTGFVTEFSLHAGQKIHRKLGPDEIIMYNSINNNCVPMNDYLNQFPEEYGIRKYVNDAIIKSLEFPKTEYINPAKKAKPEKEKKKILIKNIF